MSVWRGPQKKGGKIVFGENFDFITTLWGFCNKNLPYALMSQKMCSETMD